MKKKILTIQGSDLKKMNIQTDTSFFLGLEAQKRNYDIYYYEPKNLSFENGKVKAQSFKVKFLNDPRKPIKLIKRVNLNLLKSNLLLIRNEPPFNQQYINTTFILEHISKSIKIVNEPKSLREVPEKLFSIRLAKYMPPTLIGDQLVPHVAIHQSDGSFHPIGGKVADEPWLRQATRPFFEALDERILRVNEQSSNKGWKEEFCSNAKELIAKFK